MIFCAFCGKGEDAVQRLVHGIGAAICEGCLADAHAMLMAVHYAKQQRETGDVRIEVMPARMGIVSSR